ncbi:hypothetical protein JKF63_06334 [Porcisia hertigi]|uniref:Uncharacterized protein n=1 Tax=Porcisia hertigi TaxID=2761500 RepID=A0A836LF21_9TRYP|nr:hypothetical protein JKF63_06334 [Porcisia hertigi]
MSSTLLTSILAKVENEVHQRLCSTAASAAPGPSTSVAPFTSLSLLTSEDWSGVRCSLGKDHNPPPTISSTTDDVKSTWRSHQPTFAVELLQYVQLRCAELPMRLQIEALQTRRYEHLLRQHTRELVALSEYMTLIGCNPPTLAPMPRGVSESTQDLAQLPDDLRALLAEEEIVPRLERCKARIRELETMIRQDAEAKLRCCQRMVLLSEFVHALVRHATAQVRMYNEETKSNDPAAVVTTKRRRTE